MSPFARVYSILPPDGTYCPERGAGLPVWAMTFGISLTSFSAVDGDSVAPCNGKVVMGLTPCLEYIPYNSLWTTAQTRSGTINRGPPFSRDS